MLNYKILHLEVSVERVRTQGQNGPEKSPKTVNTWSIGTNWTETCRKGKNIRGANGVGTNREFSKIRGKSAEWDTTSGMNTIIPY